VVPHGGKAPGSVSPPAPRGDVSSPLAAGAMRTVVLFFATHPTTLGSRKINEIFDQD
jgi:hypothetical protein